MLVADRGEVGDWLDDAGFVVGEHGGDRCVAGPMQRAKSIDANDAVCIDGQATDRRQIGRNLLPTSCLASVA